MLVREKAKIESNLSGKKEAVKESPHSVPMEHTADQSWWHKDQSHQQQKMSTANNKQNLSTANKATLE